MSTASRCELRIRMEGHQRSLATRVVIKGNQLYGWPGSAISVTGAIDYADCFEGLPCDPQQIAPSGAVLVYAASRTNRYSW